MKKTILATAIILAGTAGANAAEVYNKDGVNVNIGGSLRGEVTVEKSGQKDSKTEFAAKNAGSRFNIEVSKDLNNGLTAVGYAEVKYGDRATSTVDKDTGVVTKGSTTDALYFNEAYAGISSDVFGALTVGKQYDLADDLFSYDFSYSQGHLSHTESLDSLRYVGKFGPAAVSTSVYSKDKFSIGGTVEVVGLTLGANYGYDKKPSNLNFLGTDVNTPYGKGSAVSNSKWSDAKLTAANNATPLVAGAKAGSIVEAIDISKAGKQHNIVLDASYTIDALTVAATYQHEIVKYTTATKTKNYTVTANGAIGLTETVVNDGGTAKGEASANQFGLGAKYALGEASVYGTFEYTKAKVNGVSSKAAKNFMLGADYQLTDGVITYAEFAVNKAVDKVDTTKLVSDKVFAIGARVYF